MVRFSKFSAIALILVAALSSCASITHSRATSDQMLESTACRAQIYLQKNGYLEHINSYNPETLHVDILDRMRLESSTEKKIRALLDKREGTFKNKLYGVKLGTKYSMVAYQFESDFYASGNFLQCITSENDGDWISLIHQPCIDTEFVRISESDIDCRKKSTL